MLSSGHQELELDGRELHPGLYFLRYSAGDQHPTPKINLK